MAGSDEAVRASASRTGEKDIGRIGLVEKGSRVYLVSTYAVGQKSHKLAVWAVFVRGGGGGLFRQRAAAERGRRDGGGGGGEGRGGRLTLPRHGEGM